MLDTLKEVLLPHVLLPSDPDKLNKQYSEMVRKSNAKETEATKKVDAAKKKVNVTKHEAKVQPSKVKKAKRVKQLLEDPAVKKQLKKKVSKQRDREVINKTTKAGGDDSVVDVKKSRKTKKQKEATRYDIKVPKQKAFEVETHDDQVKMHQLLLAVAKKGSGTSTAVC